MMSLRKANVESRSATRRGARTRPFVALRARRTESGLSLVELLITVTVLAILSVGAIPLVKNSVRRQKEYQLRAVLRDMREAIKEFKRDTVGIQCGGAGAGLPGASPPGTPGTPGNPAAQSFLDPRSKVIISDCTIFGVDNPDQYPPDLETLVSGVNVVPRNAMAGVVPGAGLREGTGQATDNKLLSTKKKVYLREIPIDPMTGEANWCLRSSYDPPDTCSESPVNVFDVRSRSEATSLNGQEKYSDW